MYYLSEERGAYAGVHCLTPCHLCSGLEDYSHECDDTDIQLCWQYACQKPPSNSPEFFTLAEILIEEENLQLPATPNECISLYFVETSDLTDK